MTEQTPIDCYEVLQVSPRAASETIERVFRFLAKRFHPDNSETGDADRFATLVEAYRTLSDPERRVAYDVGYDRVRARHWQLLDRDAAGNEFRTDERIQSTILSLLYSSRRKDVDNPGMGIYEIERLLDCPAEHMKFHMWYLKENSWVQRMDNGQWAVTAAGVDKVRKDGVPPDETHLLSHGDPVPSGDAETAETDEVHVQPDAWPRSARPAAVGIGDDGGVDT